MTAVCDLKSKHHQFLENIEKWFKFRKCIKELISITVWMINHIQLSQELCSTTDQVKGKEDTDNIYLMKKLVLRRPRDQVLVTSWWLLLSLCVASCVHVTPRTADLILPGADHTGTAIPSQHHRRAHMCCTCQALGDGHTVTCRIGK